jgi:hypothetical protein
MLRSDSRCATIRPHGGRMRFAVPANLAAAAAMRCPAQRGGLQTHAALGVGAGSDIGWPPGFARQVYRVA